MKNGWTLVDLLAVVLVVSLCLGGAALFFSNRVIGALLGLGLGSLIWWRWQVWTRTVVEQALDRPRCHFGRCSATDYSIVHRSADDRRLVERCRCGSHYILVSKRVFPTPRHQRFMLILDDGSSQPYMRRHGPGTPWVRDEG